MVAAIPPTSDFEILFYYLSHTSWFVGFSLPSFSKVIMYLHVVSSNQIRNDFSKYNCFFFLDWFDSSFWIACCITLWYIYNMRKGARKWFFLRIRYKLGLISNFTACYPLSHLCLPCFCTILVFFLVFVSFFFLLASPESANLTKAQLTQSDVDLKLEKSSISNTARWTLCRYNKVDDSGRYSNTSFLLGSLIFSL